MKKKTKAKPKTLAAIGMKPKKRNAFQARNPCDVEADRFPDETENDLSVQEIEREHEWGILTHE